MNTILSVVTLPENFVIGAIGSIIFGLLGIQLLLLGFKFFDWILPKVDFQDLLNKNPIAAAIVIAAFFIALGQIVSSVLH